MSETKIQVGYAYGSPASYEVYTDEGDFVRNNDADHVLFRSSRRRGERMTHDGSTITNLENTVSQIEDVQDAGIVIPASTVDVFLGFLGQGCREMNRAMAAEFKKSGE